MSKNPTRLLIFVTLLVLSGCFCFATPSTINTVAGGGPDGIPALHANLLWPSNAIVDSSGRVYFTAQHRVYRLTPTGDLEAIAGVGGGRSYSGDGLPALNAELYYPSGLAFDAAGNLFIADTFNGRVRKVDAITGIISTVAGGGASDPGDGGLATDARLTEPIGIVFDGSGNLYISDWDGGRVRRVDAATQMISTYAGGGAGSGNGVPATSVQLSGPSYLAIDATGNLYISEWWANAVRRVDALTHDITTVAGGLGFPTGLALDDGAGLLYIAAQDHVYRLDLATFGISLYPALFNYFSSESFGGLALDGSGHLFIGDSGNNRLQRMTLLSGAVVPVAGNGADFVSEDGFPATKTFLDNPFSAAKDSLGNLYVAEGRIRRVDAATGLVGTAQGIPIGGGAAQPLPQGSLLMDGADNLYIASGSQIFRRDASTGMLQLVAGTGTPGFSGDGGPATLAELEEPWLGSFDGQGNLFFADFGSVRIRRVDALTGIITTVAGNGSSTFSGDGGPAVSAGLDAADVAADAAGNLYIPDWRNNRVRKVDALTGIITTYAGTGVRANGPDNVPATQSPLNRPSAIAIDGGGNVHVADHSLRVRRIDAATQIITTVAGSGIFGFYGDGGPASAARFEDFTDLFFDASDSFYTCDAFAYRVRKVSSAATGNPPVAVAQADDASGCTPGEASVHLDGSSSSDPDSSAGTNDDIVLFEWFEHFGAADEALLGSGETLDVTLPSGIHAVTLRVTDNGGLSDTDQVTVVVGDAVAPQIQVSMSPTVLSPANKKFVPVHATVTASDACGAVSVVLLKITATDGDITYDPAPASDVHGATLGSADFDFELRALRTKSGSGRIYTVVYQATDASGNSSLGSATVQVPLHRNTPSQDQGKTRNPPLPRD